MSKDSSKLLIIDTDCGVDDSLGILLALSRHEKDWLVRAITCCRGVTNVDQVSSNVLRILNYVGLKQIPVYKGCSKPILDNPHYETDFHGQDGLGDASSSLPLDPDHKVQGDHAALALIEHATQKPGQITLLAIGPLTNLALAQRLEPRFSQYLKQLVIMGGNVEGTGNQTAMAEFNLFVDPEAAQIVLTEFQCPITVYPWEPCLKQPLPWPWFDKWLSKETKVAGLIQKITATSQTWDRDKDQRDGYLVPDAIATACCLFPDKVISVSKKARGVAVELSGQHCRGLMVLDKRNQPRKEESKNEQDITLIIDVNMEQLLAALEPVTDDVWLTTNYK